MKTKIIRMKNPLRKAILLTGFCILSVFWVSANFSNPDEDWKSSPADISTISSTEKMISDQAEHTPFGEDDTSQSLLRAAPPGGGGTGQKEETPVGEGIWLIAGLAVIYGVTRRKSNKDTQ